MKVVNIILIGLFVSSCQHNVSRTKASKTTSKLNQSSIVSNEPLSSQKILQELKGGPIRVKPTASSHVLELARQAKAQKNFVLALKRYNTLLVKFPKSSDVKLVYFDKAQIYRELGLPEQAKINQKKYEQFSSQVQKSAVRK